MRGQTQSEVKFDYSKLNYQFWIWTVGEGFFHVHHSLFLTVTTGYYLKI